MFRLGDRVIVRDTGLKGKILNMQSIGYWKDGYCYSMCTVLLDNNLGLTEVPEYGLRPCINYTEKRIEKDKDRIDALSYAVQYNQIVNQYLTNDQKSLMMLYIDKVVFNNPATIVFWKDGTKTVVKCGDGDTFDPEKGLAMAIAKKVLGNKGYYYEVFKKWLPKESTSENAVSSKFKIGDRVIFSFPGGMCSGIVKEIEILNNNFIYTVETKVENATSTHVRLDERYLSFMPV